MFTQQLPRGAWVRQPRRAPCCHLLQQQHRLRTQPRRRAATRDADLPQRWSDVVGWAKQEFQKEVGSHKPDAAINLARACLLVALEEEAAIEVHPELEATIRDLPIRFRSMASASTWSLERLDALAAEVQTVFLKEMADEVAAALQQQPGAGQISPQHPTASTAGQAGDADASAAGAATVELAPMQLGSAAGTSGAAVADGTSSTTSEASNSTTPDPSASNSDAAGERAAADTGAGDAAATAAVTAAGGAPAGEHHSGAPDAESDASATGGSDDSGLGDESHSAASGAAVAWDPQLACRRMVRFVHAVNTVLFERHGYAACNRYGIPRDAQLSSVMESGVGCSAALSLLYMEVCARLGVSMAAKPLERGRYFVLWPSAQPIIVDGERFVVDPYGLGGLLMASEVCELFEVEPEALWQPASRRQLLAALLGDLRDSHWARALGCSPNPRSIVPLSLETALEYGKVGTVNVHSLRRCLAAAEKRLCLLPNNRDVQLEFALLHYFSGNQDDAWIELGILLEKQQQQQQQQQQQVTEQRQQQQQQQVEEERQQQRQEAAAPPFLTTTSTAQSHSTDAAALQGWRPGHNLGHTSTSETGSGSSQVTSLLETAGHLANAADELETEQVKAEGASEEGSTGAVSASAAADQQAQVAGSMGSGQAAAGDEWELMDAEQMDKVRVLFEKVRLQLTLGTPRGR